jgi:hypothetical protein
MPLNPNNAHGWAAVFTATQPAQQPPDEVIDFVVPDEVQEQVVQVEGIGQIGDEIYMDYYLRKHRAPPKSKTGKVTQETYLLQKLKDAEETIEKQYGILRTSMSQDEVRHVMNRVLKAKNLRPLGLSRNKLSKAAFLTQISNHFLNEMNRSRQEDDRLAE